MNTAAIILTWLCGAIALVWTVRHVALTFVIRSNLSLDGDHADPPAGAGRISVLVPAKDERENIGPCLASLLAQDYDDFEIIVIDDRSTDGTADVAREIAGDDTRVRVVTLDALPDGWCGKNHAVHRGAAEATGDWLLTVDADCRQQSTRSLSVAVACAIEHEADLLSVLPTLRMQGFWENVVQPVCGSVLIYWFQPAKVNDPASGPAYANGAFMLFRRQAYEAVGGHAAIRGEMMEDIRLAERVKQSGHRLRVVGNGGLYDVRMYTSFGQIIAGWSRIFFGAFRTRGKVLGSMTVLALLSLLPYLVAAIGWLRWSAADDAAWLAPAVAATLAAVVQVSLIGRLYVTLQARWQLCWTWPIGCIVAMAVLVRAYRLHAPGSSLIWRDTAYATGTSDEESPEDSVSP